MPNIYQSTATIVPLGAGNSVAGDLLGGAAASFFGAGMSMNNSSPQQLLSILNSQTLAETVLDNHTSIVAELYPNLWDKSKNDWISNLPKEQMPKRLNMVNDLKSHVAFSKNNELPILEITAEFPAPHLAKKVADAYLKELQNYITNNSLTKAKQNRQFIEGMLEENKKELLEAGKELAKFYETNIISNVGATIDANVSVKHSSEQKVVKNIPQQVYLEYLTQNQQLLAQVTQMLAGQYETAKIEENKENLLFQLLDVPQLPIQPAKPQRRRIVFMTIIASSFLAIAIALFRGRGMKEV